MAETPGPPHEHERPERLGRRCRKEKHTARSCSEKIIYAATLSEPSAAQLDGIRSVVFSARARAMMKRPIEARSRPGARPTARTAFFTSSRRLSPLSTHPRAGSRSAQHPPRLVLGVLRQQQRRPRDGIECRARSGRLHWPHRGRLKWPHFASLDGLMMMMTHGLGRARSEGRRPKRSARPARRSKGPCGRFR